MKIGFVSLGCPKNLVDAEVMLGLAESAGHEITADPNGADVLVVNTCAFIDRAKQESIDTILEMAELKKQVPGRRLVVTGCMAERYRDELKKEIPEIDAVLGTGEVPAILQAIQPAVGSRNSGIVGATPLSFYRRDPATDDRRPTTGHRPPTADPRPLSPDSPQFGIDLPDYLYDADTPRRLATPGHYAYLKIAEGCDYKCAFCIIPKMRGHYRSRTSESIVKEAHALVARGVKELLLISQDTTFYGIDRKERGALPRLLRELDAVDGLEWIRLLYLYPTTISDDVIAAIAECDKVVKYIDLPLQHASDAVLQRMKRPGTRAGYEKLLAKIRARIPGVTLRTTFIVGFPGETDQDFDELMAFIETVGFDHLGVFTYSHEEGTSAFGLVDDVPAAVKKRRQSRLMARQKQIVKKRQKGRVGERARLIVDGPSPEHELVLRGRLGGQAPDIDPLVYLTECDVSALAAGDIVDVEIVGAHGYDLVARPVDADRPSAGGTVASLR
ncbi:MAG TPA: 30S ribosomal protein S12 methylthiotransferase RimO [Vicinamibacterales bacterium]|nr:30S ribosomal protein S12 methylthiotransferase RimO [Vicinamibacterales bacterium]